MQPYAGSRPDAVVDSPSKRLLILSAVAKVVVLQIVLLFPIGSIANHENRSNKLSDHTQLGTIVGAILIAERPSTDRLWGLGEIGRCEAVIGFGAVGLSLLALQLAPAPTRGARSGGLVVLRR